MYNISIIKNEVRKMPDIYVEFANGDIPMPQGFGKQKGWICPVCGRDLRKEDEGK